MRNRFFIANVVLILLFIPITTFSHEWVAMDSGTTSTLYSIWGSSGTDVFAVGEYGTILHYDGSTWSPMDSGTTNNLYGIWGSSETDIFIVGEETILHYNGTNWSFVNNLPDYTLLAIWGSSETDIYAGGYRSETVEGCYCVFAPVPSITEFFPYCSVPYDNFYPCWPGTIDYLSSAFFHSNGATWSEMVAPDAASSIWGCSGTDIFISSIGGEILHGNGSEWLIEWEGYSKFDIWGASCRNVFAVGDDGTILHHNGTTWSPMVSGTTQGLTGIWGSSGKDIFAVGGGGGGVILHYDGAHWVAMKIPTTYELHDVWGSSKSDVFAVGDSGTILHLAGSYSCNFSVSPLRKGFNAGGGSGDVYVITKDDCYWTAESNDVWISITSGSSGTGNGTISYSVAANTTGKPRKGTMTIAGETFTVLQRRR